MILFYSKNAKPIWSQVLQPYDRNYIESKYKFRDHRGRYRRVVLTAPGVTAGESGKPWQGYDPSESGRHWTVPRQSLALLESSGYSIPPSLHERLDLLLTHEFIRLPIKRDGAKGTPEYKRYLGEGHPIQDVITDIPPINSQAKERLGYPTQKPLALLKRIIEASSDEGHVVLDPFAGCVTACIAAEELGRQWIGIDISEKSADLIKLRMERDLGLFWQGVIRKDDLPRRSGLDKLPAPTTHRKALYGEQGGFCNGCNMHFQPQHLEVDHIIARKVGGTDHIENLQLLCGSCNKIKGQRGMEYLRVKLGLAA